MSDFQDVCALGDIPKNSGVCALVNGEQVALFRLVSGNENSVYAIGNYDPVGGANVLSRGMIGDVKGSLVVASPLYKHHFRLEDGKCLEEDVAVPAYQIKLEGDRIMVGGRK